MKAAWTQRIGHLLGVALLALSNTALANPERWQLNMPEGVTATSKAAYSMHMIMLIICVIMAFIVFGAMIVSMIRDRKSRGAKAATWSHNTLAEAIWTIVPILILIGMAYPATQRLILMADAGDSKATGNVGMTVKITGYQWKWRYQIVEYKGVATNINFISSLDAESNKVRQLGSGIDPSSVENYLLNVDKPLVLPTDTKIRFVVTADDVIHAWWVPDLGWKQDAIPGVVNEAWSRIEKPGVYRGQCTELCGKDHGFMPIVVDAKPVAEFESWLAAEQTANTPPPAVPTPAPAPTPEPAVPVEAAPVDAAPEATPAVPAPPTTTG